MRIKIIIAAIIAINNFLFSQTIAGAKQNAMANATVALSNDVFAHFNNPAGLAQMNWREIGVYYSPAPFGFTELANAFLAYNEPLGPASLSFGAKTYGFKLYRENNISAGAAYNFSNKFFVGFTLNFRSLSIKNYGRATAFYLNIGTLTYITPKLRWGFFGFNINRASLGKEKDQIPVILTTGFSYDVLNNLDVNIVLEKDIHFNPSLKFGIDYLLIENLSLQAGFSNEPAKFSAGVGIYYSYFNFNYAFYTHQVLGLTHQIGLIINFGNIHSRKAQIRSHLGIYNNK